MSAFGTKQTPQTAEPMSAFGRKADMGEIVVECLLLTQSGHQSLRIVAAQNDVEPHFAGRKSLL